MVCNDGAGYREQELELEVEQELNQQHSTCLHAKLNALIVLLNLPMVQKDLGQGYKNS